MGILDDAIREHLDLKRRQGAEEDELQRLEDEAFGPPARPGEPDFPERAAEGQIDESAGTGESIAVSEPPAAAPEATEPVAPDTAEEPVASPPAEAAAGPFYDQSGETAAPEPAVPPERESGEPPIESLDTVEHPFTDAIEDTGKSAPVQERLTTEEPVTGEEPLTGEEEVVEGEVAEEEDVLEETPEFLRDQPEDDELWFEQGEPKDFDF